MTRATSLVGAATIAVAWLGIGYLVREVISHDNTFFEPVWAAMMTIGAAGFGSFIVLRTVWQMRDHDWSVRQGTFWIGITFVWAAALILPLFTLTAIS